MQFAADAFMFFGSLRVPGRTSKHILVAFSFTYGLKINFSKSSLYQINGNEKVNWVADLLGCSVC